MSGVSEPIGGLFGYLVLNGNNELSFAIVFGIVAGECGGRGRGRGRSRSRSRISARCTCCTCLTQYRLSRPPGYTTHYRSWTSPTLRAPPTVYSKATLYRPCCTAGMMVYISIKELIPTALRYDPKDTLTTTCVIAGMVVMAASLLLFTI
jgi:hypothetical protein